MPHNNAPMVTKFKIKLTKLTVTICCSNQSNSCDTGG